jgi:hypothetical protein
VPQVALAGSIFLGAAVFLTSGCGTKPGPAGSVSGKLEKDCGYSGCVSALAKDRISASRVWCSWKGSNVLVHFRLTNPLNAHVTASIAPRYEIEAGGTHGDSFGSDRSVGVDAKGVREVTLNAGHPEGVPDDAPISKCSPRLVDIDITNPSQKPMSMGRRPSASNRRSRMGSVRRPYSDVASGFGLARPPVQRAARALRFPKFANTRRRSGSSRLRCEGRLAQPYTALEGKPAAEVPAEAAPPGKARPLQRTV